MQVSTTFWAVTHSPPGGERATLPHFNQDIQGFLMTLIAQIFWVKQPIIPLNVGSLVSLWVGMLFCPQQRNHL